MANSTANPVRPKPAKPRADFPLFPHATGRWAKKVRGKFHYFGKIADDPKGEAAILLWLDQKDDLLAGRLPRTAKVGLTVRDLANRFLTVKRNQTLKRHQDDTPELSERSFKDYYRCCERVLKSFGSNRVVDDIRPEDFEKLRAEISKTYGPVALCGEVTRIRGLFKYAYDAGLVDVPVRFGPTFRRPTQRVLRAERQRRGSKMFEAAQIRRMLQDAPQPLHAMILLGANCGYGNSDVGNLTMDYLDLDGGWVTLPRSKTSVQRRCPLWPETVASIKQAMASRPAPADAAYAKHVFLTRCGTPWSKAKTTGNPVSAEMGKLLRALKLHRPGVGFYSLRHVFETIGGETADQVAVSTAMGHCDQTMSGIYRERISDDRLRNVVACIRSWLWPEGWEKLDSQTEAAGSP